MKWNEEKNERKSIYWYYTKIQFKNSQPFHLSIQSTTSMARFLSFTPSLPHSFRSLPVSFSLIALENYCVRDAQTHEYTQQFDKVQRMKNKRIEREKEKKGKKSIPFIKIKVISVLFRCYCSDNIYSIPSNLRNSIQFNSTADKEMKVTEKKRSEFSCCLIKKKKWKGGEMEKEKSFSLDQLQLEMFLMIFLNARLSHFFLYTEYIYINRHKNELKEKKMGKSLWCGFVKKREAKFFK